jgi:hypothetical protein
VLRVRLHSKYFRELDELICTQCVVPPPEPSRCFAEGLRLFDQFLQESNLDAAQQSIDIFESLLVDFHNDVSVHDSVSAAFPSNSNDTERPIRHQRLCHVLIQLARTLEERHRYAGDTLDLESAVRYGEEALTLCHADNMVCPTVWVFCADILGSRYEVTTSFEELRIAEMLCREAIPLIMASHPLKPVICHTLSWIVLVRFEQSDNEAVINEAIHLQRAGLEQLPEIEVQNRHRHLHRLVLILRTKDYYMGHQNNDDIISTMEEAFRICPPMHVDRWTLYPQMMTLLLGEYYRSGELEFLNRAIKLGRQSLSMGVFSRAARRSWFCLIYIVGTTTRNRLTKISLESYSAGLQLCLHN